jgi:CheY-like chemotaxis protein
VLREEVPAALPVTPPPVPALRLLTSEDVERIEAGHAGTIASPVHPPVPERAPAAVAGVARAAQATSPPGTATQDPRPMHGALVAEDSITARIFLARLLTRLGFDVRTVDTAAALRAELERGPWSLVCVDIELPDEAGTAFLAGLVARHAARTPFIALVRDADDRAAARRAGIERMLRKPFDHQELEQVLGRLGLVPRRPA